MMGSCSSDQSGLEQIEFATTVHLSFHQFELGDLPFDLTVGPWLGDRRADGGFVVDDTPYKGCDQAGTGVFEPRVETGNFSGVSVATIC